MSVELEFFERKVFSQNGEDGIIESLLTVIGIKNKYYVEFGVESGIECNTRHLRENLGFTGLLMDGRHEDHSIGLHKEIVNAENINDLFSKYNVPNEFDVLSIDIDFNDLYVWKAISDIYKPSIVVIEYNAEHAPPKSLTVRYDSNRFWDGTNYFGASLAALNHVAKEKGYTLVYCDRNGVNAFFVKDELLDKLIFPIKTIDEIFVHRTIHAESNEHMVEYLVGDRNILDQLKVYNVGEKIRIGAANDGGYVLPKQSLEQSECLFSYGINNDITFDEDYIQLTNKKVYGYDHTIEDIETKYPELFTWYKKGMSGTPQEHTDNFLNHYKELGISGRVLLKVDVELCEYEWLENTNIQELANITTCVILEVHCLHDYFIRERFDNCMKELNKYFYLCHIHGNNYGSTFNYAEQDVPTVLELTFVPKELVSEATLTTEIFPTDLDAPNNINADDINLNFITNL